MRPITDEELMLQSQNGDQNAFSVVAARYREALMSYLSWGLGNVGNVEAIHDQVLIRARRPIINYRFPQKFATWLFTFAYRAIKR